VTSSPFRRERGRIGLANELVPFALAAQAAGLDIPEPRFSGARAWCPFGEFAHPDGGREKALRVYHDHAFCFAEWLWLSPCRIVAMVTGTDEDSAAEMLLDRIGHRPVSYIDAWERLTRHREDPDLGALAEALRIWLSWKCPQWASRQYDEDVSGALSACLSLLGQVRTAEDCQLWLARAKQVMERYI
jgi:hypothetical protein